jgi:hypothetical protein
MQYRGYKEESENNKIIINPDSSLQPIFSWPPMEKKSYKILCFNGLTDKENRQNDKFRIRKMKEPIKFKTNVAYNGIFLGCKAAINK